MKSITAFLFLVLSKVTWSKGKYDIKQDYTESSTVANILSFIIPVSIPVLWLITIVIILKSEFKTPVDKLIWVIVSFVPIVGPILFFAIGSKQRIESERI